MRRSLTVAVIATLSALGAVAGSPASATTTATTTAATTAAAAADDESSAVTQSKALSRTFVHADGTTEVVDKRTVTVTVEKTAQLRGRERVHVTWKGAHPSSGRAADPYGEAGLDQEYPVVVLQCRGVEKPTKGQTQLRPETCWTSTRLQRAVSAIERTAVWRHDLHATEADRQPVSGLDPYPASCPDATFLNVHLTPFVAAEGTTYAACSADDMPPEAAVGAAFPPAEIAAFTDEDGRGEVQFEIRSDVENESLGCSEAVDCSIVVIPIMGISCLDEDAECQKTGRFVTGSNNFSREGVDDAVSPRYWWSASNWRGRISVPITLGLPPDACDILDDRAPTSFFGSELMSQASLQWAPAYCLRKDRFKFQHSRMGDEAAFAQMTGGEAPAAFVSSAHEAGADPVGYAPTALTGFSIAYSIDRPENRGEVGALRLNARLLAKLLTQSYPASDLGRQHPGLETNPISINLDPEFQALNPGLDTIDREAAATILALSDASDVTRTLTEYLAADPEAKDFIAGKADPWGMTINPSYKGIALPVAEWPILDTFVPTTAQECRQANPVPYLPLVASPVSTMRKVSEAILDAWPNVQTRCERPSPTEPWKLGRVDRQGVGTRFVIGVTSLGDAERYGLRSAALQTRASNTGARFTSATGRTFVGPTEKGILAAVGLATQETPYGPFTWTQAQVSKAGDAYPGTQLVYTAARLSGADAKAAATVADFITIATTEGQKPGSGNGRLPEGFVPLTKTGSTAPLLATATKVAAAIRAQDGLPTPELPAGGDSDPAAIGTGGLGDLPSGLPDGSADLPDLPGGDDEPVDPAAIGGEVPADDAAAPAGAPGQDTASGPTIAAAPRPRTPGVTSGVARVLLPAAIAIGPAALLLAGAGALARRRRA
ncbi:MULTISPECIES: hypothetical protein [unclassified Janibacter]|uniref:hypothetical protein n=1 Tax=unclassified Janibacter TaxID=2649294 RepID=UPI003D04B9AE